MFAELPRELGRADCSRVRFHLDFLDACRLPAGSLLRLRRPLCSAARTALAVDGADGGKRFAQLFDPPPSADPVASRKFQKPAPPFVICPSDLSAQNFEAGDRLDLEVLFIGTGTALIGDFLICLEAFGRSGLHLGEGRFEVTEARSIDLQGLPRVFWRQTDQGAGPPAADMFNCEALLEEMIAGVPPVRLEMITPARIVHKNRRLRSPTFAQLFPFMLRRVTALLHAHCGIELCQDPTEVRVLQAAAGKLQMMSSAWTWRDWREMGPGGSIENIGGTIGSLRLTGPEWERVGWVVGMGALFGIGKGAAYGAGRYRCDFDKPSNERLPAGKASL